MQYFKDLAAMRLSVVKFGRSDLIGERINALVGVAKIVISLNDFII